MPETIDISLQFENMLSLLFGKDNHHGDIGNMGKTDWKKNLLKIINAIEKSFSQNVNYTDEYQKTEQPELSIIGGMRKEALLHTY